MAEGFTDDGWVSIRVPVPPELVECGVVEDLQRFVDAMVYKLRRNSHKGRWADLNLDKAFSGLQGEVQELDVAVRYASTAEIWMEAADVANTALIVAAIALEKARPATPERSSATDDRPRADQTERGAVHVAPRRLADELEDFGEATTGLPSGGGLPDGEAGGLRPRYRRCIRHECACDQSEVADCTYRVRVSKGAENV